jgi:DNA-binding response OmpR family regulator
MREDDDGNDISGLEVAKYAAEFGVPCIILTAFPSTEVVRQALRSRGGKSLAVVFVTKSAGPQAVIDAIAGIVRRSDPAPIVAELEVDPERQVVRKNGEVLDLSRLQYTLLAYLYQQRGTVCPADELIRVVYGEEVLPNEASADKRFERLIARLREKIEDDPSSPVHLVTVPGRGYRLETPR